MSVNFVDNVIEEALEEFHFNNQEKDCPICLEKMLYENSIKTLYCNHYFHKECIITWVEKTLNDRMDPKCPCCREELIKSGDNFLGIRRQDREVALEDIFEEDNEVGIEIVEPPIMEIDNMFAEIANNILEDQDFIEYLIDNQDQRTEILLTMLEEGERNGALGPGLLNFLNAIRNRIREA